MRCSIFSATLRPRAARCWTGATSARSSFPDSDDRSRRHKVGDRHQKPMWWVRENLTLDRAVGIVGLVAGVFGGIFLGIENYSLAEWCIVASALMLIFWTIAQPSRVLGLLFVVLIIGTFGYATYAIHDYEIGRANQNAEEVRYSGHIVPANETDPELPKSMPHDSLQLLLGDDLRVIFRGETDTRRSEFELGVHCSSMRCSYRFTCAGNP